MNDALPTDILNFFAKYKESFNQLDGVAVASLYRVPSVIVDDASYTIWDSHEKIENNMMALCDGQFRILTQVRRMCSIRLTTFKKLMVNGKSILSLPIVRND
jgi:hypothetical protein